MKTITISDETYEKLKDQLTDEPSKEKVVIYKTDGSVLHESDEVDSVKELAEERKVDLWKADLWKANLRGANLSEANLSEANLWKANLSEANLWKADLWKANLRGANLWGANLSEASLGGAKIKKSQINDLLGALGVIVVE